MGPNGPQWAPMGPVGPRKKYLKIDFWHPNICSEPRQSWARGPSGRGPIGPRRIGHRPIQLGPKGPGPNGPEPKPNWHRRPNGPIGHRPSFCFTVLHAKSRDSASCSKEEGFGKTLKNVNQQSTSKDPKADGPKEGRWHQGPMGPKTPLQGRTSPMEQTKRKTQGPRDQGRAPMGPNHPCGDARPQWCFRRAKPNTQEEVSRD